MTTTVRQILQDKAISTIYTVDADSKVFDALTLMADKDISAVLIMDGDRLAGIFTERDYARKVALHGRSSREVCIGELMTKNLLTVEPSQTVDDVMAIMTQKRIRHLPVLESGKTLGIVTIGDAVKTVMKQQEQMIKQLSSYISGEIST